MEEGTSVQRAASANKVCPSGLKLLLDTLLPPPIDDKNTTKNTSILISVCATAVAAAYMSRYVISVSSTFLYVYRYIHTTVQDMGIKYVKLKLEEY